ncbi:type-1 fimbrial protein subunit A [Pseudomonas lactis]|nr:type-1 fimbrial protein subunit A [Pseudomonas lactis]
MCCLAVIFYEVGDHTTLVSALISRGRLTPLMAINNGWKSVMNKGISAFCGAALAMSCGIASAAVTPVTGGTIKFTGSVVNAACAVSAASSQLTVNMGQVRLASFTGQGVEASRTPFTIELLDCDTAISQTASIKFQATASSNPQAFDAGMGSGRAQGIGLQIRDQNGVVVTPNTGISAQTQLIPGRNILPFQVNYISLVAAVEAGDASANIDFVVNYQ